MSIFSYKIQVQIVVASIALHNYIRRNVAFTEFDRHPNIIPHDIFSDVVSR